MSAALLARRASLAPAAAPRVAAAARIVRLAPVAAKKGEVLHLEVRLFRSQSFYPEGKTGRLKLQQRRTRPANREEKKRAYLLLQLARRRPRPSSDVFCFCFSPLSHSVLFICTHSLSVSQNRSRSGPRRPPRWPSSGSAARRGTPTS